MSLSVMADMFGMVLRERKVMDVRVDDNDQTLEIANRPGQRESIYWEGTMRRIDYSTDALNSSYTRLALRFDKLTRHTQSSINNS
jgi:hypothetical protein